MGADFYSSDKTMFRAHPTEKVVRKRGDREVYVSRWLAFIWAVNEAAGETPIFGEVELLPDVPCEGYLTEQYSGARVIHSPKDEGVRIVADSPEARAIFAALLS